MLKTRMGASCAAGIMYLLETNTGTSSASESCVIIEQYFDLMSRLIWVAGMSVSTIGGSGDTTIPSPETAPKQPLPGIGLHDPLHGRQACSEFNPFHQVVGQISPPEGLLLCRPLPQRGQICYIPSPPNR